MPSTATKPVIHRPKTGPPFQTGSAIDQASLETDGFDHGPRIAIEPRLRRRYPAAEHGFHVWFKIAQFRRPPQTASDKIGGRSTERSKSETCRLRDRCHSHFQECAIPRRFHAMAVSHGTRISKTGSGRAPCEKMIGHASLAAPEFRDFGLAQAQTGP
jgi:hypothetical protein